MKSYTNLSIMTFLSVILISCTTVPASNPAADTGPAARLASAMAGTYLRPSPSSDEPRQDRRVPLAPLGDGQWIYYQVNQGLDLEQVYRQRVLNLSEQLDGRVTQTTYTLTKPEDYQAMDAPIDQITLDQLTRGMESGCDMVWIEMPDGWSGRVDPSQCVIFSQRRQTQLRIGSRADIASTRLRQAETGYDLNGNRLWGSEDGEWMVLYRTP